MFDNKSLHNLLGASYAIIVIPIIILILETVRGNSLDTSTLMAVVISFFIGLIGVISIKRMLKKRSS